MKIFVYKTLFVFVCVFIIFQLTFGAKIKQLNAELEKIKSQENINYIKNKVRNELRNAISKENYLNPEDAKGKRYRVSASLSSRYFAKAIGADLIPMGYGEIVQSLQTDLIEAGDNSVALYVKSGKEQEAPHYTLTKHSLGMSMMVARKAWWDELSEEHQVIIKKAWPQASESRRSLRAEAAEDLAKAEQMGITVYELNDAQRQQWKDATQGQVERLAKQVGGRSFELIELINEGKKEFQSSKLYK